MLSNRAPMLHREQKGRRKKVAHTKHLQLCVVHESNWIMLTLDDTRLRINISKLSASDATSLPVGQSNSQPLHPLRDSPHGWLDMIRVMTWRSQSLVGNTKYIRAERPFIFFQSYCQLVEQNKMTDMRQIRDTKAITDKAKAIKPYGIVFV